MQINEHESDLDFCQIAGPLYGPNRVVINDDTNEQGYLVRAVVEPQDGRYTLTSVEFSQKPGGPPVQRRLVGQIRLEAFVYYAATIAVMFVPLHWRPNPTSILEVEAPDGSTKGRALHSDLAQMLKGMKGTTPESDDDYQRIADLYRWLRIAEGKPSAAMGSALEKSPATIKRWLAAAVKRGLLDESERTR